MTQILKLQTLTGTTLMLDEANMAGSAISTICPLQGGDEAGGFQME